MKRTIMMIIAAAISSGAANALELEGLSVKDVLEMTQETETVIPAYSPEAVKTVISDNKTKEPRGNALVPQKTIQLVVEQNSLDLAGYSAEMTVRCSYKSGLFWPQTHSCGRRKLPVEITAGNRLLIPAVEAFDGPRGGDLDNFGISVTLKEKGNDRDSLFSLDVRGEKAFKVYLQEKSAFSILKMDAASVDVLVEGRPLAGSELSKNPYASLMSFVLVEPRTEESDGIMLVSPLGHTGSFDNQGHASAGSLADFKVLSIAPGVFIEKVDDRRRLELLTSLKVEGPDGNEEFWRSRVEIRKTADGLKAIRQVDLKKVN